MVDDANSGIYAFDNLFSFIPIFNMLFGLISIFPSRIVVLEGEALGLLQALNLAIELDMSHVVFETECKGLVDKVYSSTHATEAGSILKDQQ